MTSLGCWRSHEYSSQVEVYRQERTTKPWETAKAPPSTTFTSSNIQVQLDENTGGYTLIKGMLTDVGCVSCFAHDHHTALYGRPQRYKFSQWKFSRLEKRASQMSHPGLIIRQEKYKMQNQSI